MAEPQTFEKWIDVLTRFLGDIDNQGKKVRSYALFEKREYPATLNVFPCWLTNIEYVRGSIGSAGASILIWIGTSELHFAAGSAKNDYPDMLKFYNKTLAAFLAHRTLGGKVDYCMLDPDKLIEGPVMMQYGTENEHPGLIAHWMVKESVSGVFTLGN